MAKRRRGEWTGTADEALALLRAEYSFLRAHHAALRSGGTGLIRRPRHHAALVRAGMNALGHAYALASLIAAAPTEKWDVLKAAFSELLSAETAAHLRGWVDGTDYWIEGSASMGGDCWWPAGIYLHTEDAVRGLHHKSFQYKTTADEAGALALAAKLEDEARRHGVSHVEIRVRRAA